MIKILSKESCLKFRGASFKNVLDMGYTLIINHSSLIVNHSSFIKGSLLSRCRSVFDRSEEAFLGLLFGNYRSCLSWVSVDKGERLG